MDKVIALLVLSSLPLRVTPVVTSLQAVIKVVPQASRIFTGESIRLTCSVNDNQRSVWDYQWFRDSELLPQTGPSLSLWNAKIKESGNFSCGGVRDILLSKLYTRRSPPVEIRVDGGLAILQVLPHPGLGLGLVGKNVSITCRVRRNPPVHEIILYKDGTEVRRESGLNPQIHLTNLSREDEGMYSCRASWDVRSRTISVISAPTYLQISGPQTTKQKPSYQQPPSPTPVSQPSAPPTAQPVTTQLTTRAPPHLRHTQEVEVSVEGSSEFSEESGDFSEESGDFSEESGDFSGESGDFSGGSSGLTQDFDDMPEREW